MTVPGKDSLRKAVRASTALSIPADVAAVLVIVAAVDVAVLVSAVPTPVRAAFGVVMLFFLPGYGIVTALFPAGAGERPATNEVWSDAGSTDAADEEVHPSTDGGTDVLVPPGGNSVAVPERLALGVGTSLAVLPVIGLVLAATGLGFTLVTEVGTLSLVAVGGVLVGWVRRSSLPEHRRFRVSPRRRVAAVRRSFGQLSRAGTIVTVLLVVATLLAAGTLSYALLVPPGSAGYTDLSLLTETDDGDLVAADYPSEFQRGETREVVSAIGNHEGDTETYTLVVELQRVRTDDGTAAVVESRTVDRRRVTVQDGERVTETIAVTPEMTGEDLRLTVLLYRDPPPDTRAPADAYRSTYIWVDVGTDDASGSEDARSDPSDGDDTDGHVVGTGSVAGSG